MDKTKEKASVLIVDDSKSNLIIINEILKSHYEILTASDGKTALQIAHNEIPDLVLLDIEMPDMDGYEVCKQLKNDQTTADIPVIFITARTSQQDEVSGFEIGAVDYITKPISPPIVLARVNTHVQLKQYRDILEHQATYDGLTGIPNRRSFNQAMNQEWSRCVREHEPISVGLLDIDHFKLFNDQYGHQKGDECLIKVARTLASELTRDTDLIARYGGEEFACILPNTDYEGAQHVINNLLAAVSKLDIPHAKSPTADHVTISIGLSSVNPSQETKMMDFLKFADKQLYAAKNQGRNRIISKMFSS